MVGGCREQTFIYLCIYYCIYNLDGDGTVQELVNLLYSGLGPVKVTRCFVEQCAYIVG